jgi:hypothetical protein
MNPTKKIKALQFEIGILQKEIRNCNHDWDKTKYDPETVKERVFVRYEGHGSDPEPIYNWNDKTVPRWSRTCKVCGRTEHTNKTGPVKSETEPKFD